MTLTCNPLAAKKPSASAASSGQSCTLRVVWTTVIGTSGAVCANEGAAALAHDSVVATSNNLERERRIIPYCWHRAR